MNENVTTRQWEEVVALFRRMCFLRRQGKAAASEAILKHRLPETIAAWSQNSGRDAGAKKAQLDNMFQVEQRRVDDAFSLHELSALQWQEDLLPALVNSLAREIKQTVREQFAAQAARNEESPSFPPSVYRPRIAFDDIPAVIDLIAAEEQRELILKNHMAA
jgi:hypothetical protein